MLEMTSLSERRACRLAGLSRDSFRHPPEPTPATQALSARLIELGYMKEGSNDGNFGSGTEAAVKAFQEKNKLKADGIAGKDTLGRLYSDEAFPK